MVDKSTTLFTGVAVLLIACIFISESAVINVENNQQAEVQGVGIVNPCIEAYLPLRIPHYKILQKTVAPMALKLARLASDAYKPCHSQSHKCFYNAATSTEVVITTENNAVFVAFRGTQEVEDYFTDAKIAPVYWSNGKTCWFTSYPCVHLGFYQAYKSIYNTIVNAVIKEIQHSHKQIFITGHSLGGAIATLFAYGLYSDTRMIFFRRSIHLYTFGCPPIGNPAFTRNFNNLRIPSYIITIVGDAVSYERCTVGNLLHFLSPFFNTYRKPNFVYYLPKIGGHQISQYIQQLEKMTSPQVQGITMSHQIQVQNSPRQDNLPYESFDRMVRGED